MTAIECDDGIDEAHWGRLLGRRAKRCHVCSRSIWECDREGGPDCILASKENPMSGVIARTLAAERLDTAIAQAVVEVVKALLVAASPCTPDSHEQAKTAHPSVLHYHGVQTDDDGVPMLVLLNCPRCHSTLAVEPDAWLASAVHPPRLEVVR